MKVGFDTFDSSITTNDYVLHYNDKLLRRMKTTDRLLHLYLPETLPQVELITFKHAASGVINKRKGYSLTCLQPSGINRVERLVIEPVHYSNGDRWLVRGDYVRNNMNVTSFYAKNLPAVCSKLEKREWNYLN